MIKMNTFRTTFYNTLMGLFFLHVYSKKTSGKKWEIKSIFGKKKNTNYNLLQGGGGGPKIGHFKLCNLRPFPLLKRVHPFYCKIYTI